ncbi:hypothetical protein GLYMA_04G224100v4 [Glycine max]|nr:hypothetical protein GLYMA_04G224100v4 [Glycine max]KAH1112671.1 hypothetical protein GYH30_010766 [Glycine max]
MINVQFMQLYLVMNIRYWLVMNVCKFCHHGRDHAGGNEKIKQLVPGIKVYGSLIDNVIGCTDKVENGDKESLGADIYILCLHTPCHTKGHISYYVTGKEEEQPAVFTGDTLEKVGCKSPVEALRELRKLKDNWKG